jgi:ribosomal-protein-alanine N-acetyltransferase
MKNGFPTIETERLLLTLPPPSEAARMLAFVAENREHLAPWSPPSPPDFYSEGYWRERLASSRDDFLQGRSLRLALFSREDPKGRVQGVCNFNDIIRGCFHACYLGYNLDHRAVGQGMMYEALTAAIKYVFDELRLHRIMANYRPQNERSARLLERMGFRIEGFAQNYLLIDGEWRDHVLTSLTNSRLQPSEVR